MKLARPVIFGLADGAMSILGVVFYAAGHSTMVFPLALSGGLSAAVSMAAGEWLSESGSGPAAAIAMGAATLTGSIMPAVPFAFTASVLAPVLSVLSCIVVALVVATLRAHRKHPYIETFAALGLTVLVAAACTFLFPGGAQ